MLLEPTALPICHAALMPSVWSCVHGCVQLQGLKLAVLEGFATAARLGIQLADCSTQLHSPEFSQCLAWQPRIGLQV